MKVNNEISDKTSQELNEKILAAKIILDLLIFLAITTALPLIIVYLINNQKEIIKNYPIIKNVSDLSYDLFYILSGISSILIIIWHIASKGAIKHINDAILTLITAIAALKIFEQDKESISLIISSLTNNQGFLFFCKQLIIICGFAKVGISLFEFAKERIKKLKRKVVNGE
ncbi:hypothetical protein [Pectobacterium carotovorum]|uniref:hypothetical protein n=1 Tax=Pectobacterium carotovorum TaxID=554 RepID=UPI0037FD392E